MMFRCKDKTKLAFAALGWKPWLTLHIQGCRCWLASIICPLMKPWWYFTPSYHLLVFFLVLFTLRLIDYKLGYHWNLFSFTVHWSGNSTEGLQQCQSAPSMPPAPPSAGEWDKEWCPGTKGTPRQLTSGTLESAAPHQSFSLTPKPHIQGLMSLAFQKLFNIRNGFLSTPSFLPQRISHSSRETDKSFLSEFKYKFIFKTGLITKLQFVLCEGICLYHKNHSC